ncbi:aldo-keto reductase family 1 member B1-like [Cylas formicarius]|uniref:aldo-keto reductase family 1 member B1-like n=1 Tax=Cylas formicarius TaxID=197179 RepID=UPI0029583F1F|nr:aldo-keto reductase family 1 member B1-like [Cylas formicarius]
MAAKVPKVKFNNGNEIPIFGLGTWKSKPGEVEQAVKDAIDIGYRHIDCAHVYQNEQEVGKALKAKFSEGGVKREDLFITTKLWNTYHRPDLVEKNLKISLADLGLEYVDLYLIHWPMAYKEDADIFPRDSEGNIVFSDVDYVDTWKALEKLVEKGLAKSIGLSNFNKKQIERVLAVAKIQPANLQVECHPYLNQSKLIDFARSKGITVTAYSPLGSPDRPWAKPDDPQLLDDPKLLQIAKKYNKTSAQVLLRYQVDRGIIVIPKSVTKSRIQQNFEIFDFSLSKEDIEKLNAFDCNGRLVPMTAALGHKHHPFENDEY